MSNRPHGGPRFGPGPGGPGGRSNFETAKDFSGTLRRFFVSLKPYYLTFLFTLVLAIGSTLISVMGPDILSKITDELVTGLTLKYSGTGGINFDKIAEIALFLLCLYGFSALLSYIQHYVLAGVSQKYTYQLRKQLSEKMKKLPLKYYDSKTHGEISSIVTNDIDTISQTLSQSLSQIITSVVTLIGYLVMMLRISWQLTLIALLVLPISMTLLSFVIRFSQRYFRQLQESLAQVNGQVEEMYGGHTVIKAFNYEDKANQEFETVNDALYQNGWRSQFISGLMMPLTGFVGNLAYVCVILFGGMLVVAGTITLGNMQAIAQYIRNFNQPISQVAQITNIMQSAMAAAERVFAFLSQPEEVQTTASCADVETLQGTVAFENVTFGYDPEKIIIHDFSAYIGAGKKCAIVGPTGAGKTTIIKLLMRFYELNSGSIMVDGYDIKDFTRNDLRSLFGVVLQDAWLFAGTIMENIRYGKPDATDEEVMKAADGAYVDHFIRTLSEGYQTVINEESSNISAGQKQLLTIARAFLADPKILILDEATSSVDTRTEVLIQKGMENLMKGRTSFIIAHRLSTIRDADLILVMNDGDIVEVGSHSELMAADGFYAGLYNSQFQGSD